MYNAYHSYNCRRMMMRIQDSLKKIMPSYLVEKHLVWRLNEVNKRIRETNEKNEYLFWLSQMQLVRTDTSALAAPVWGADQSAKIISMSIVGIVLQLLSLILGAQAVHLRVRNRP